MIELKNFEDVKKQIEEGMVVAGSLQQLPNGLSFVVEDRQLKRTKVSFILFVNISGTILSLNSGWNIAIEEIHP